MDQLQKDIDKEGTERDRVKTNERREAWKDGSMRVRVRVRVRFRREALKDRSVR